MERFRLYQNMKAAVEWRRVGVDSMKFVVKCERLIDEMGKQDVGWQQLCYIKLHLVCHKNHQTTYELHLSHEDTDDGLALW